jgi:alpha-aminoadipate/glutamate carrier protein LysW
VFPETRQAVSAFVGKESCMPVCQECESVLDFDPDEVEEGDIVVCDECGTEFEIVATEPLELSKVDQEGYEDEDEEINNEEEE